MIIQICVGSSCHLKGSEEIVKLFSEAVEKYSVKDDVTLAGSFCLGQCSSNGVTVKIDDKIITGVSNESFPEIFKNHVLSAFNIK